MGIANAPAAANGSPSPGARFAPWCELAQRATLCGRLLRTAIAERAESTGLGDHEFFLLWSCHAAGREGLHQTELAVALGVSPAQISGLVERLNRRGLLVGRRDERDRRRQYWHPSPSGVQLLDEVLIRLTPWLSDLEQRAAQSQVLAVGQALEQMHALLQGATSPPLRVVNPEDFRAEDQR